MSQSKVKNSISPLHGFYSPCSTWAVAPSCWWEVPCAPSVSWEVSVLNTVFQMISFLLRSNYKYQKSTPNERNEKLVVLAGSISLITNIFKNLITCALLERFYSNIQTLRRTRNKHDLFHSSFNPREELVYSYDQ